MKKIVLLFTSILAICLFVGMLSSCNLEDSSITYSLKSDTFKSEVALGEKPDASGLVIVKSVMETYEEIPVTDDMITSWGEYETVGETNLIVSYLGRRYQVPYTVKYKVDFVVSGEIVKTQLVLRASEILAPTATKDGFVFAGWNPAIPAQITENMRLEATFELETPALSVISATYGDTLGMLTLPENASGKWCFADERSTPVGNVGTNEFNVSFIQNGTGKVLAEDTVTVQVSKKQLTFENVQATFVYDGKAHFPTYTLSEDVQVITIGDEATDVGTYSFGFIVNDANYTGSYEGSFEVQRANATVYVDSVTINAGESVPALTYRVEGFNNEGNVLGISIVSPTVTKAGEYVIDATYTNKNVNVTVQKGKLTVISTQYSVDAPTILTSGISYGDKLFDVEIAAHPDGIWTWDASKYNATTTVGEVGENVFAAIFTPNNSLYEPSIWEVTLSVSKKSVTVTWSNTDFVYNGTAKLPVASAQGLQGALTLTVSGEAVNAGTYTATATLSAADAKNYELAQASVSFRIAKAEASILANDQYTFTYNGEKIILSGITASHSESALEMVAKRDGEVVDLKNAGTYEVTVTLPASANYNKAQKVITVTVEKVNNTDEVALAQNATYGDKLGTLTLPLSANGTWSFVDGEDTTVGNVGSKVFVAKFTATNSNYNDRNVEITVTVAPKTVSVIWANDALIYNGEQQTPSANAIGVDGTPIALSVSGGRDAGTHTAEASTTDTNYVLTNTTVSYTISPKPVEVVWENVSFVYSGTAHQPTATAQGLNGALQLTVSGSAVNAGAYTATASIENSNYTLSNATVRFTVAKAEASISANDTYTFTYTGSPYTLSNVAGSHNEGALSFKITKNDVESELVDAGVYKVTITLAESANYKKAEKIVTVIIRNATNTDEVDAEQIAIFGDTLGSLALPKSQNGTWSFVDGSSTKVGSVGTHTFVAKFTSTNSNYEDRTVEITVTVIAKTIEVLWSNDSLIYNGKAQAPTASANGIDGTISLVVAGAATDAGTYTATATLADKNYELANVTKEFTISPKSVAVVWSTGEFVYNGAEQAPVASAVGVDGDIALTVSGAINAGKHTAFASTENANYTLTNASCAFEIQKLSVNVVWTNTLLVYNGEEQLPTATAQGIDGALALTVAGKQTNAGTYTATASLDDQNYSLANATASFSIAKADSSILAEDAYTFTYNGHVFALEGIEGSHNESKPTYVITKDGAVAMLRDAGVYQVTITLAESANYKKAEKTVTVTVNKAENTDVVDTEQEATYGDTLGMLVLPKSEYGVWSFALGAQTAVGTVGQHTFTAKFASTDANYNDRTVQITVNVAKKAVDAPQISNKGYIGAKQYSGLSDTEIYTVVTDEGGTEQGTYTVTLKLVDNENYKWKSTEEETLTLTYAITGAVNEWVVEPSIENSTYGDAYKAPVAQALYGGYKVEYCVKGSSQFSESIPTLAGAYIARFTTTDMNATTLIVELEFTIAPKQVEIEWSELDFTYNGMAQAPTATVQGVNGETVTLVISGAKTNVGTYTATASTANANYTLINTTAEFTIAPMPVEAIWGNTVFVYNGGAQAPTASATGVGGALALAVNGAQTNAGTYTATATLADANYTLTNTEVTFTIAPKQVSVVWGNTVFVYNGEAQAPTANATGVQGEQLLLTVSGAQTNVGAYTATAGTDNGNYTLTNAEAAYTITPKEITVVWGDAEFTYSGEAQAPTATANGTDGVLTLTVVGAQVNVGTYTATATTEDANYTLVNTTAEFTIAKKSVEVAWTNTNLTYNSGAQVPTATATGVKGEAITVTVSGAQTNAGTYTATASTTDANYELTAAQMTYTISKAEVTIPTILKNSFVFTGETYKSGLASTALYTVVDNGGIAAGTYSATLTLVDNANYKWADGVEGDTRTLTYEITKATNAFVGELTINGWTYGDEANAPVVGSSFGTVVYKYATSVDGEYTESVPENAGTYFVKAFVSGTQNYAALESEALSFTIAPKSVAVEWTNPGFIYNGAAQAPTATAKGLDDVALSLTVGGAGTNVGAYTATATIADTNYTLTGASVEFTIAPMTVSVLWDDKTSFTYNGKAQAPTANAIGANAAVLALTVSGAQTNAGTYTATASLADGNYALTNTTIEYTIAKLEVKVSWGELELSYTGEAIAPTAKINGVNGVIALLVSGAQTEQGEGYEATASLSEADAKNYILVDTTTTFKIGPSAPPKFDDFTLPGGPYYMTDMPVISGNYATVNGEAVKGTYVISGEVLFAGENSTVEVTFIPENSVIPQAKATMTINLKTVATIGHNGTGYGSIKDALDAATDGDKVYVLPDITGNVIIKEDTIVLTGVTLILPWGSGASDYYKETRDGFQSTLTTTDLSGQVPTNLIMVQDGVTLTVNGTLTIGGELSGGSGGSPYAGHTAGNYAELQLGQGSQLIVNGTLHAFGFITESDSNNTSRVTVNNGGTVYQPFVLRDFRGGTQMKYMYENSKGTGTFFKRFLFMNIHATIQCNYGSSLKACANLYANSAHTTSMANMLGATANDTIQLTNGAYLIAKYDDETEVNTVDFYGGFTMNALKITVSGVTASSTEFLFGLGYNWQITLNGDGAVYDTRKQAMQMLPGFSLTVNEGATLKAGKIIVLDETYKDSASTNPYPTYNLKKNDPTDLLPGANLTVYGKMTAIALGGVVHTDDITKIEPDSEQGMTYYYSSRDLHYAESDGKLGSLMGKYKYDCYQITRTEVAFLECDGRSYAWIDGVLTDVTDQIVTVTINMNGGKGAEAHIHRVVMGQTFTLPEGPEKDGFDFQHWSADGATHAAGATYTIAGDVTFTAEWAESSSSGGDDGGCVTPDTLITLADGTQVRVDSLTGNEMLLVWNMETGMLDFAPIMFVDMDAAAEVEVITLYFSDGTTVKVITEHGFWDYDLNRYVYLDRNAADYIGHTFAKQNGDALEKVQLVDVTVEVYVSEAWSPVTVGHLCYFVNGMLSMPGGVGGLFNIFEVDGETMTYDYEAIARDIETYGLYTYEELNALCPLSREMFEAAGGAYLKISIGKGNLTEEELFTMIRRYSKYFSEQ